MNAHWLYQKPAIQHDATVFGLLQVLICKDVSNNETWYLINFQGKGVKDIKIYPCGFIIYYIILQNEKHLRKYKKYSTIYFYFVYQQYYSLNKFKNLNTFLFTF